MSEPYVGEVRIFSFNYNISGYSQCLGQPIQISQNQALYAVIGIAFGGNGTSTFNLPDLQGRVPAGQGQGSGLTNYVFAQKYGNQTTQLSASNLPPIPATYTPPTIAPIVYTPPVYTQPTAATTLNAYTAPTARQVAPTNGLLTGAQDSNTGASVTAYSTAGTATTLASGAATTTLSGGGITGGSVTGGGLASAGSVAVNPTGTATAFSNIPPTLVLRYVIATTGIFPVRT